MADAAQQLRARLRLLVFEFSAQHCRTTTSSKLQIPSQQVQKIKSVITQIISSIKHEKLNQSQQGLILSDSEFCKELYNGFDELHATEPTDTSIESTSLALRQQQPSDSQVRIKKIYSNDFSDTFSRGFIEVLCIRKDIGTLGSMAVSDDCCTDIESWIEFYDVLKLTSVLMIACPKQEILEELTGLAEGVKEKETILSIKSTISYIADLCVNMLWKHRIQHFLQKEGYLQEQKNEKDDIIQILEADCQIPQLEVKMADLNRASLSSSMSSSRVVVSTPSGSQRRHNTDTMSTDSWTHIDEAQKTTPTSISENDSRRDSNEDIAEDQDNTFTLNVHESSATLKSESSSATITNRQMSFEESGRSPSNFPLPASGIQLDKYGTSDHDLKNLLAAASNSCLEKMDEREEVEQDDTDNDLEQKPGSTPNFGMGQDEEEELDEEIIHEAQQQAENDDESTDLNSAVLEMLSKKDDVQENDTTQVFVESTENKEPENTEKPEKRNVNLSVDSVQSDASGLTSITPATPPLACYNSMIDENENIEENSKVIDEMQVGEDVKEEESVGKAVISQDAIQKEMVVEEIIEEVHVEPKSTQKKKLNKNSSTKNKDGGQMDVATVAAIGGAVAGLTAYLYLKLK